MFGKPSCATGWGRGTQRLSEAWIFLLLFNVFELVLLTVCRYGRVAFDCETKDIVCVLYELRLMEVGLDVRCA